MDITPGQSGNTDLSTDARYGVMNNDFVRGRVGQGPPPKNVADAIQASIDLGVKSVQDAVKTVGGAVSSVFSPKASDPYAGMTDDQIRAATYPQLYKSGQKIATSTQKTSVRQGASIQGRAGVVGNKGSVGPAGGSQPSSFTQDFNAITNGILQVFGVVAASKQAKQQARGASGPRGSAGDAGQSGGVPSSTMYYLIGGGILVAGVLIFAATRK